MEYFAIVTFVVTLRQKHSKMRYQIHNNNAEKQCMRQRKGKNYKKTCTVLP